MAEILFTHCNHLFYDSKQISKMQPYPPLETLIAAAFIRKHGFDVTLFDPTLTPPEAGFRAALQRHKPKLVVICEDSFNFIAKMCLKRNRETAFRLIQIARDSGIPVVINSPDSSLHPSDYLANGIHFVIVGEPENTLADLMRHLLRPSSIDISTIPGIFYVDGLLDGIRHTPCREPERELKLFPMPAWDLIDMQSYRNSWIRSHGFFSLNMASSRGCPYNCSWCAKPIFGPAYRLVPAKRAAEELRYLKEKFSPDQIWFADDVFAISPGWTNEFADAISETGAQLPFKIQSRCDLITEETAADLERAGCSEVWLGVESGSQRVLDAMRKGICVDQIHTARILLKNHGMRVGFFLQFGYPSETWPDIQNTIEMVRETIPDYVGISVSYPLPGTDFYDGVALDSNGRRNWLESGDLSMLFCAAYKDEFYAALHSAIHLEVDILNGRASGIHDRERLSELWAKVQGCV